MNKTVLLDDKAEYTSQELERAWQKFVDFLQKREFRITQARRYIFEHIFLRHDHFRADEIAVDLSSGINRVSRATVYHTLDLMVQANMVRVVRDSGIYMHYEHTYGHPEHEHMICSMCGRFYEFTNSELNTLLQDSCASVGFELSSHSITIFGICSSCMAKEGDD